MTILFTKVVSDMKCPFCNGELVGTIGHPICRNQDCVMCDDPMPQDLLEELIRTRKALDVAVDALGYYASENSWDETNRWMFVENGFEFARDVLVKIDKTLEQKD